MLRLPSPVSLPSVSLGVDTASQLPGSLSQPIRQRIDKLPGPLVCRLSRTPAASCGGARLSQVPVETCCPYALFLDPDRHAYGSPLLTPQHCCSRFRDNESSGNNGDFEARSHGLWTHCLRFVPASQLTTQDSVSAAG